MSDRRDWQGGRAEEERVRELLGSVREEIHAPAGFHASVMRAVEEVPDSFGRRVLDWWLRPRPLRLSPAHGLLAAVALAGLLLLRPPAPAASDAAAPVGAAVTRFVLVAPEATSVHVTGDFLSWSPQGIPLLDPRGTGVWTADVPLPPGVYQYTFVIDGTEWRSDPGAVSQVDDGFGQVNSVVIVPGGSDV